MLWALAVIHTEVYVRKDTCAARSKEKAKQIYLDKRKPSVVETDLNKVVEDK